MNKKLFKPALLALGIVASVASMNVSADYQYSIPGNQIQGFKPYIAKLGVTGNLVIGATISVPAMTISDGKGGFYEFIDADSDPDDTSAQGSRAKIKWYAVPKTTTDGLAGGILLGEGPNLVIPNDIPAEHHIGLSITPTTATGYMREGTELVVNNIAFLAGQLPGNPDLPGADPVINPALPGDNTSEPNPGIQPSGTDGVPVASSTVVEVYEYEDFKVNGLNAKPIQTINSFVKRKYIARVVKYAKGLAPEDVTVSSGKVTAAKPIIWRLTDVQGNVVVEDISKDAIAKTRLTVHSGDPANSNTVFETQPTNDKAPVAAQAQGERSEQGLVILAGADIK